MRLRAYAAVVLALLSVSALLTTRADAAVSPRSSYTAWTLEGAADSDLVPPGYQVFTGTALHTQIYGGGAILFWVSGGSQLLINPPSGQLIQPGTYPTTARDINGVMVGLTVPGGTCYPDGTLQVYDVQYNAGSAITSFAATYSLSCAPGQPAVVGELRYNSTIDLARSGRAPLGTTLAPQTVTVTAEADTTFGTAAVEGLDADQWRISSDGCSGQTVTAGGTCTLSVVARPTVEGGLIADLRLPADTGDRFVGLTSVGVNTATGALQSLTPVRMLDTRTGLGAPRAPIGQGRQVAVKITGRGGVPLTGVSAVVANVTVVAPSAAGYLTLYPSGGARPVASSLNFPARWTGANQVTVQVGSNGYVNVFNYAGSTNVVIDIVGFYHSSASTADPTPAHLADYQALTPRRAIDTRTWGYGPLLNGQYAIGWLDFGAANNTRIRAIEVNVTVVAPQGEGYFTAWDGLSVPPRTSTLNFTRGATVANSATIPAGQCTTDCGSTTPLPSFAVLNTSTGAAHLLIDVVGVYFVGQEGDRGWRYQSLTAPQRIVDTRKGQGIPGALGARATATVDTPGNVADYNTEAVVSNVTAVAPSAGTYLTLWRNDGTSVPGTSNLNAPAGRTVANMAVTPVWTANDFNVFNAAGTTHLLIDAAGTMEHYPAFVPPAVSGASGAAARTAPRSAASPGPLRVDASGAAPGRRTTP